MYFSPKIEAHTVNFFLYNIVSVTIKIKYKIYLKLYGAHKSNN